MSLLHSEVVRTQISYIMLIRYRPIITFGLTDTLLQFEHLESTRATRGGGPTYHDPGQLVVYPIIRCKDFHLNPTEYTQFLQNWIYQSLQQLGYVPKILENQIGIWLSGQGKVAFIGARIKNGVSLHGFAINLQVDLSKFEQIDPCGQKNLPISNLEGTFSDLIDSLLKTLENYLATLTQSQYVLKHIRSIL